MGRVIASAFLRPVGLWRTDGVPIMRLGSVPATRSHAPQGIPMLRSRVCTLLMVEAAVVVTSLASSFQEQAQRPQAPPQFRAEVTAVLVDVLVLDERGRPVAGLGREDFQVLEDGVLQEIENFDVIDWSSYVGREPPQGELTAPELGAVVNAFPRRFIFIINRQNASTRFIRRAKMALEDFVVESMADEDEALVLDMGLSTKVLQEFKDSKEETLQTIRKISLMEVYRGEGSDRVNDLVTRNVYDTLESLGQGLGQFPGRKIVIFMSTEFDLPLRLITYLEDTVDAFNQSNTTVYSIDISGVGEYFPASSATPSRPPTGGRWNGGLFPLANETGGRYYYNLITFEPVLRKIGIENSLYYQLIYTSTNTNYDGKYRSIQVKVGRPNVEVMTRRGYFAKKAQAPEEAAAVPEEPSPPAARASAAEPAPAPAAARQTEECAVLVGNASPAWEYFDIATRYRKGNISEVVARVQALELGYIERVLGILGRAHALPSDRCLQAITRAEKTPPPFESGFYRRRRERECGRNSGNTSGEPSSFAS